MSDRTFRVFVPLKQWAIYEVDAENRSAAIDEAMALSRAEVTPLRFIELDSGERVFAEEREG